MSETSSAIESANLGSGLDKSQGAPPLKIAAEKTGWLGRLNERASEFCSSILVKETRQALKSKQFIWTYMLLLLCVGIWTVFGLATTYSSYDAGRDLLIGFWFILGFPLALIIPFSAYRSMAREFEDGTIHLISITTMKPYQIVVGKFGSAILQMIIYLSVLAPCICFTYMLRGISMSQIGLGLLISIGGSICLTSLGLFLAGVFRSRALGVGVSVLFVLFLGWLYYLWCLISDEFTRYGGSTNWGHEERILAYGTIAFLGSTAILLLVTAASQISFPSDNRSTWIRVGMFVQQILFFALAVMVLSETLDNEIVLVMVFFAGHYWLVMGFLMIGESTSVSRRVQRTLPRNFFSRSFFSLFMPGAGRGFLFAVANVWTCVIVLLLIVGFSGYLVDDATTQRIAVRGWGRGSVVDVDFGLFRFKYSDAMIAASITSSLFVTWFLAVVYLINQIFLNKRKPQWSSGVGPTISLIIGAVLIAGLSIGSLILHMNFASYEMRAQMSAFMAVNWYFMTVVFADVGPAINYNLSIIWFVFFVFQALAVIVVAFVVASRELLVQPVETPERVQVEIQERTKKNQLPEGETIDEIFGELN